MLDGDLRRVLHYNTHRASTSFHQCPHHNTYQNTSYHPCPPGVLDAPCARPRQTARSFLTSSIQNSHFAHVPAMFCKSGLQSHNVTLLSLLSAFTSHQYLSSGLYIHCYIVQVGLELDVIMATALVNMYSKCGSLEDAWGVFDFTTDRDVVLWTAIITAYAKRGFLKEALETFESMLKAEVTPDAVSFVSILNACSGCPTFDFEGLHEQITSAGLDTDFGVGTALLNLHVKRGNKTEARDLFNKLPKHNRITWNSILSLYARLGYVNEGCQLFYDMLQEGLVPDAITFVAIVQVLSSQSALANVRQIHVCVIAAELTSNVILSTSLMNGYGKCNSAGEALGVWECIVNKNVVVWSAFIAVLTQLGLGQQAVESFYRMQDEGIVPNEVTYASMLEACTLQRLLTRGQQMHACLVGSETMSNVTLVTVLVNLYSTCGNLDQARTVFDYTEKKDVLLWTALISAHMLHSHGQVVAQMFNQMQEEGVLPNVVTFVCVLDACSTLSALAFGKHVHARLGNKDVASKVDVGTALVNMYGKCGGLACAHGVFDAITFKDRLLWSAIISAYAHNGDDRNTLKFFDQMVQQGVMPDCVTFLSIMCACSHSGLLDLGIHFFFRMNRDFGLEPLANHFDCMIDLLRRAGQLNVAEHMVDNMPAKPNEISWTTLLGAYIDMH